MSNQINVSVMPMIEIEYVVEYDRWPQVIIRLGDIEIDRFKPECPIYDVGDVKREFSEWFQRRMLNPVKEED